MKNLTLFILSLAAIVLSVVIGCVHGPAAGLIAATVSGAALLHLDDCRAHRGFVWAVGPWTLMDLAARSGKNVVSLMEGVLTQAPELRTIPTFARQGLNYTTLTRTALPSGDFAKAGSGVATVRDFTGTTSMSASAKSL